MTPPVPARRTMVIGGTTVTDMRNWRAVSEDDDEEEEDEGDEEPVE